MRVTQRTLIILAALVWYSGGIALIFKGSALIQSAHLMDPQSIWAYTSGIAGIILGLIKGKFLFSKACSKNVKRIRALEDPRIWQCFRPGMLLFLAIIIPTGAWMSRAAAGKTRKPAERRTHGRLYALHPTSSTWSPVRSVSA